MARKTYKQLKKRWECVINIMIERIPELQKNLGDDFHKNIGYLDDRLRSKYSTLARLDYLLNNNLDSFRENLELATNCKIRLFEKFDQRGPDSKPNPGLDPMAPSLFSMLEFEVLLDCLASGNINLSKKFADLMGGRPWVEEEYDDDFTLAMGYSLKYAVGNNKLQMQKWLPKLKRVCENPEYTVQDFYGYYLVLEALLEEDVDKANAAFEELIKYHEQRCKYDKEDYPFSDFHDSPDEDLFVWGIGMANLCRYYGLNVKINDSIIPEELLIPVRDKKIEDHSSRG